MAILTRSARCVVFHRDEADCPQRFTGGPYYFKPLHAPFEAASYVGFACVDFALDAAEAFEAEFAEEAYLPGEVPTPDLDADLDPFAERSLIGAWAPEDEHLFV